MDATIQVNIHRIQYLAIIGSILMLIGIVELIRKKRIKEEYALLWLFGGIIFLCFAIWRIGLHHLSYLIGIAYPPATLLLIFVMGVFAILVHYSIVITKLSEQNKRLIQEVGLLKWEIQQLKTEANSLSASAYSKVTSKEHE